MGRVWLKLGMALLAVAGILSGGTLEVRHHLLLGALIFVSGTGLLVWVTGSSEAGS
jgi:hypothetical protein